MKTHLIAIILGLYCFNLLGCASYKTRIANEFTGTNETYAGIKRDVRVIKEGGKDLNPLKIICALVDIPFSLLWDIIYLPVDLKKMKDDDRKNVEYPTKNNDSSYDKSKTDEVNDSH